MPSRGRCVCGGSGCFVCGWGKARHPTARGRRSSLLNGKSQEVRFRSNSIQGKGERQSKSNQAVPKSSSAAAKRPSASIIGKSSDGDSSARTKIRTGSPGRTPWPKRISIESESSRPSHSKQPSNSKSSLLLLSKRDSPKSPTSPQTSNHSLKSTLKSKHDREMAKRQTTITCLPPAERKKQEDWALSQLKKNASSSCPTGLIWVRDERHRSYRCLGGGHEVTDELLAEGKGGYYLITDITERRVGPCYEPDFRWVGKSEKYMREVRYEIFGTKNPTPDMKKW